MTDKIKLPADVERRLKEWSEKPDTGLCADSTTDDYANYEESKIFLAQELAIARAEEKQLSYNEGVEAGYLQGIKMLEWRINCDTLISELSGWKGCVNRAVYESLGRYKDSIEQREYLVKISSPKNKD